MDYKLDKASQGMRSKWITTFRFVLQLLLFLSWSQVQTFLIKPVPICSSRRGLSPKQQVLCQTYRDHMEYMIDGGKMALDECQYQFKERRWNCTFPKRHMRGFLTPEMPVGSREAAFTHSIVAAGTMHALSRACMETKIPSHCQCSREPRPRNLKRPDIWGGCGDNLPYGYEFSKKFVDAKETLTNSQNMNKIGRVLMNLHNNEAGRLAVVRNSRVQCRCHGLSDGCTVRTCYRQLSRFRVIGDYLREKYESSIEVELSQKSSQGSEKNKATEMKLREKNPEYKAVTRDDLVYLEDSPNYCVQHHQSGSLGTAGRQCNRTSLGLDNCKLLCCGRGYHTKLQLQKTKCGCQFVWCCYVKCKTCEREENVYYCK